MVIFKIIRWKNFLSTGNAFTEVEFTKTNNTLIIGKNGAGKSTILDALTFSLFGKSFRKINKPSLINSVNGKNCIVECEFNIGAKNYMVRRGLKPNVFEIYIDGQMLDQSTKIGDYQEHLEKYIIKMNYKSFTQIVILGSAAFTPFMQLVPADRRAIIEDLLDIQIFSTMNVVAKQKLQLNKEYMETNRMNTVLVDDKIKLLQKTLDSLSESVNAKKDEITKQISEYKSTINLIVNEMAIIPELSEELDSLHVSIENDRNKKTELLTYQAKIKQNLERYETEIHFFQDSDHCPKCRQSIDATFKGTIIDGNKTKVEEYSDALTKLIGSINKINTKLSKNIELEKTKSLELNSVTNKERDIRNIEKNIAALEKEKESLGKNTLLVEDTTQALLEAKYTLGNLETEKKELLTNRQYLEMSLSLLKDGGIKTKIIKQYLPIINKCINKYLQSMDFYVNFNIDENFEETIKSRYRDEFTYANFSEGEKQRIDLALLFSWRTIAKMKNSINTNLLILDEIFDSSLDGEGTDEFMKILQNLTKDTFVFIISHKRDQMQDKFDRVIRFEKIKDFSMIKE